MFHALDHPSRIGSAVNDCYIHIQIADRYGCLADAFVAAHRLQIIELRGSFLASDIFIRGAERCLHNTTGIAKNNTGTGCLSHKIVVSGIRQGSKIDAFLLRPQCKLSGGKYKIHITHIGIIIIVTGVMHFRSADLIFFGSAGCQRHIDDLCGIKSHFLCKIGLDRRPLHADRTLGGREIGDQLRVIHFRELDPGRAAAGKLRQRCSPFGNALDQLARLLDDREICRKIGVQYIVDTKLPEQSHHFSFHKFTGIHSELLAQGGADGRRSTDDHDLIRVLYRITDLRVFIPLGNAAWRTYIGALSAVNADRFTACLLQCVSAVHADVLCADIFTHAAFDTLFFSSDDAGVVRFDGHSDIQRHMFHCLSPPFSFSRHSSQM